MNPTGSFTAGLLTSSYNPGITFGWTCTGCGGFVPAGSFHKCPTVFVETWVTPSAPHQCSWRDEVIDLLGRKIFAQRCTNLFCNALRVLSEVDSSHELRAGLTLTQAIEKYETSLISQALDRAQGNKAKAAKLLGIKRTTFMARLKRIPVPMRAIINKENSTL